MSADAFRARAQHIARIAGWTVDFAADGAAWFLDARGHDVAQSTTDGHLADLELDLATGAIP